MLSGEILSRPPLSVALLPPPSLIQLCKAMAAIASLANQPNIDDDDIYLENGLLSYENPNYHMNPQRIERNSHLYEEILSELQQQSTTALMSAVSNSADMLGDGVGGGGIGGGGVGDELLMHQKSGVIGSNRKDYARLDVGSMGVDLKENFIASEKRGRVLDDSSPSELKTKSEQMSEKEQQQHHRRQQRDPADDDNTDDTGAKKAAISSTTNAMTIASNGNHHHAGGLNVEDLYALPNKRKQAATGGGGQHGDGDAVPECTSSDEGGDEKGNHEDVEDKDANKDLPPGWEKHEDNNGPYYWHIKSGTIQREPPLWSKAEMPAGNKELKTPHGDGDKVSNGSSFNSINSYYNMTKDGSRIQESQSLSVTRSNTSSALDQEEERRRKEELTYKRRSYPLKSDTADRPIRFAVRSMGWVEIAEEDLTPERSSKAVNKCIVDLSLGRNDLLDVVGRWGDGKDLFMDLDDGALKLIDPENLTILNTQPIHTIRVWGVGRDNGRERDFAYVARDRLTRIHMCHVFRCDTTARTIANTLRDICKRIMIERSLQMDANSGSNSSGTRCATRPTDLPTENRRWIRNPAQSFPTPMEEPKKVLKAQYLGSAEVSQPTGIDVLNAAIDAALLAAGSADQWEHVNVAVAPSMISIHSSGPDGRLIAECRVRYLSFLGIGQNVKNCAFIMHTADDKFVCHTFTCEPSSGALCKTIEAACKLRYQKCLDAHPESRMSAESSTPNKGIGATIKTLMNSFTMKKDKVTS